MKRKTKQGCVLIVAGAGLLDAFLSFVASKGDPSLWWGAFISFALVGVVLSAAVLLVVEGIDRFSDF